MRQKEHLFFAELMNRMRVQALTDEDHEFLKKRIINNNMTINNNMESNTPFVANSNYFIFMIKVTVFLVNTMEDLANYYVHLSKKDSEALALFPFNEEVNEFNNLVAKFLNMETILIEAEDSEKRIKPSKKGYKRLCNFKPKII